MAIAKRLGVGRGSVYVEFGSMSTKATALTALAAVHRVAEELTATREMGG